MKAAVYASFAMMLVPLAMAGYGVVSAYQGSADRSAMSSSPDTPQPAAIPIHDPAADSPNEVAREASSAPPEITKPLLAFRREDSSAEYVLLKKDGGTISAKEFENTMMCHGPEHFADVIALMDQLMILPEIPGSGRSSFAGESGGKPVQITTITNDGEHFPRMLLLDGTPIGECS